MASSFTEYRAAGGRDSRANQKKERKRLEKVIAHAEIGGALNNAGSSYNKWLRENTGIKLLPNGKRQTVWKTGETKGQLFDEKVGHKQWKQEYYGTLTPYEDLKYLKQLDKNETRLDRLRRNKLRIGASEKDWQGTPIHLLQVDQLEEKLNKEAEELRSQSATYRDFDVPVEPDPSKKDEKKDEKKNTNEEVVEEEVVEEKVKSGEGGNTGATNETIKGGEIVGEIPKVDNQDTNYAELANTPNAFNDPANQTNNTSTRERLTARERLRAQNVERFGEAHVAHLETQNDAFQSMKRGEITKEQFIADFPKSQTAKKARKKKLKIGRK